MSRLLGPPSQTISSVSLRASALAGEKIAGAGTMAPAASPTDLRKSRRFMRGLQRFERTGFGSGNRKVRAKRADPPGLRLNSMIGLPNIGSAASARRPPLHTNKVFCLKKEQSF